MGRFRPGNSLRHGLEALEPQRKPVSIRVVLGAAWRVDSSTIKALYKDRAHEARAICQTLHISRSTLYRYLAVPDS